MRMRDATDFVQMGYICILQKRLLNPFTADHD